MTLSHGVIAVDFLKRTSLSICNDTFEFLSHLTRARFTFRASALQFYLMLCCGEIVLFRE